jgi:hypothetical protein
VWSLISITSVSFDDVTQGSFNFTYVKFKFDTYGLHAPSTLQEFSLISHSSDKKGESVFLHDKTFGSLLIA